MGSTPRSWTKQGRTRSDAPSSTSSSRRRSRSGATFASRPRRWQPLVIEGAADAGADVLDLGMVGTEMVYFAVGELALDGGVMVTASHNPKEYTGMKIVRRGALPVGGESGLLDVRDRAISAEWRDVSRGEVRVGGHLGAGSSTACCPSSNSMRCDRFESSSTRPTGWRARCCPRCSNVCRCSRSFAVTSTRTARSRTTSPTRCCRRTATSSSVRRSARVPTSASPTTVTPTAASSWTTPVSSSPATSRRRCSRRRSSPASPAGRSSTTCAHPALCPRRSSGQAACR